MQATWIGRTTVALWLKTKALWTNAFALEEVTVAEGNMNRVQLVSMTLTSRMIRLVTTLARLVAVQLVGAFVWAIRTLKMMQEAYILAGGGIRGLAEALSVLIIQIWGAITALTWYVFWLIRTAIVETAAWAAAFWPITLIIAAIAILIGVMTLLYFKWKAFHDIVNTAAKAFVGFWVGVYNDIMMVVHALERAWSWMNKISNYVFHPWKILGFQHGGVTPGGPVVVGEAGPEIVMPPRGSRVIPHAQSVALAGGAGPGINVTVMPQAIYFDSKKIGQIIAQVKTDKEARA
jgi:hypothetical protein